MCACVWGIGVAFCVFVFSLRGAGLGFDACLWSGSIGGIRLRNARGSLGSRGFPLGLNLWMGVSILVLERPFVSSRGDEWVERMNPFYREEGKSPCSCLCRAIWLKDRQCYSWSNQFTERCSVQVEFSNLHSCLNIELHRPSFCFGSSTKLLMFVLEDDIWWACNGSLFLIWKIDLSLSRLSVLNGTSELLWGWTSFVTPETQREMDEKLDTWMLHTEGGCRLGVLFYFGALFLWEVELESVFGMDDWGTIS